MKRFMLAMAVLALAATGVADAQQAVVRQPRPQVTRSYRSYSVAPSTRGQVRHAGDATWRRADSKANGQFHGGR